MCFAVCTLMLHTISMFSMLGESLYPSVPVIVSSAYVKVGESQENKNPRMTKSCTKSQPKATESNRKQSQATASNRKLSLRSLRSPCSPRARESVFEHLSESRQNPIRTRDPWQPARGETHWTALLGSAIAAPRVLYMPSGPPERSIAAKPISIALVAHVPTVLITRSPMTGNHQKIPRENHRRPSQGGSDGSWLVNLEAMVRPSWVMDATAVPRNIPKHSGVTACSALGRQEECHGKSLYSSHAEWDALPADKRVDVNATGPPAEPDGETAMATACGRPKKPG